MNRETELAIKLLRSNKNYIQDVKNAGNTHNTVAGSVLSVQHQIPRQYAERAVAEALRVIQLRDLDKY
jgi:hypothetical protein